MQDNTHKFTIQEVSRRFGITPHTLRFWEKEFKGTLVPLRTDGGQRRYTEDHLSVIAKIKTLKKDGLSLAEIKKRLEAALDSDNTLYPEKIDLLADKIADTVRTAIYNLLNQKKT